MEDNDIQLKNNTKIKTKYITLIIIQLIVVWSYITLLYGAFNSHDLGGVALIFVAFFVSVIGFFLGIAGFKLWRNTKNNSYISSFYKKLLALLSNIMFFLIIILLALRFLM